MAPPAGVLALAAMTPLLLRGCGASAPITQERPPLHVVERLSLSFQEGEPPPLRFRSFAAWGDDGRVFLQPIISDSASEDFAYPPVHASLFAFDAAGREIHSLRPLPRFASVGRTIHLAGLQDGRVRVTARGLVDEDWASEGPQTCLVSQDLTSAECTLDWAPGLVAPSGEIFLKGPTDPIPPRGGPADADCMRVTDPSGQLLRTFGPCPPDWNTYFVQSMTMTFDGDRCYWAHFREPVVHACTLAGNELFRLESAPTGYVSFDEAVARLGEAAGPRALCETATLVEAMAVQEGHLFVTWRLQPPEPAEYWLPDHLVLVYDLQTQTKVADFRVPWRLLGTGPDGLLWWMHSQGKDQASMKHAILKTRFVPPPPN